MLEGALILFAGIIIGRLLPGRLRRHGLKPPKPVCGCSHHHSFHDPKTGECHGLVSKVTRYTTGGTAIAWDKVPCTCRQYSGPVPLPEMFAPEIGS